LELARYPTAALKEGVVSKISLTKNPTGQQLVKALFIFDQKEPLSVTLKFTDTEKASGLIPVSIPT